MYSSVFPNSAIAPPQTPYNQEETFDSSVCRVPSVFQVSAKSASAASLTHWPQGYRAFPLVRATNASIRLLRASTPVLLSPGAAVAPPAKRWRAEKPFGAACLPWPSCCGADAAVDFKLDFNPPLRGACCVCGIGVFDSKSKGASSLNATPPHAAHSMSWG